MKNIYVGNLNIASTEDEIRNLFQAYGAVQAVTILKDRDTGRSRGFAFIEMANDDEARLAISALNGTLFAQQLLSINEARSKHENLDGTRRLNTGKILEKRCTRENIESTDIDPAGHSIQNNRDSSSNRVGRMRSKDDVANT